jgi:hypothetical protein
MRLHHVSTLLALLIGLLALAEASRRPSAANALPFHDAAAAAIEAIPLNVGTWSGTNVPIPPAAQTLLKPNAILSRSYVNQKSRVRLSLALVQCRDTRDMSGHYPPICYPGQGWTLIAPPTPVAIRVPPHNITFARYEFVRRAFDGDRSLIVYSAFAIPGGGFATDMSDIGRVASDYTARHFGAAQIQIAFSSPGTIESERPSVEQVLVSVSDALTTLTDPRWRSR